ncbi:MAG: hypothetical protein A2V98_01310 [Planctomycetes bacterium RBG_16_64_12]|nr:MAG: hypothetical protein A2V98_01310 [Planctomycetes bacterium RBG_16_64_12]
MLGEGLLGLVLVDHQHSTPWPHHPAQLGDRPLGHQAVLQRLDGKRPVKGSICHRDSQETALASGHSHGQPIEHRRGDVDAGPLSPGKPADQMPQVASHSATDVRHTRFGRKRLEPLTDHPEAPVGRGNGVWKGWQLAVERRADLQQGRVEVVLGRPGVFATQIPGDEPSPAALEATRAGLVSLNVSHDAVSFISASQPVQQDGGVGQAGAENGTGVECFGHRSAGTLCLGDSRHQLPGREATAMLKIPFRVPGDPTEGLHPGEGVAAAFPMGGRLGESPAIDGPTGGRRPVGDGPAAPGFQQRGKIGQLVRNGIARVGTMVVTGRAYSAFVVDPGAKVVAGTSGRLLDFRQVIEGRQETPYRLGRVLKRRRGQPGVGDRAVGPLDRHEPASPTPCFVAAAERQSRFDARRGHARATDRLRGTGRDAAGHRPKVGRVGADQPLERRFGGWPTSPMGCSRPGIPDPSPHGAGQAPGQACGSVAGCA